MAGIIADQDASSGVAQLRNTILHTFVNSDNAQVCFVDTLHTSSSCIAFRQHGNENRSQRLPNTSVVLFFIVLQFKWKMYARSLFLRYCRVLCVLAADLEQGA
jgi:hypothetical protein